MNQVQIITKFGAQFQTAHQTSLVQQRKLFNSPQICRDRTPTAPVPLFSSIRAVRSKQGAESPLCPHCLSPRQRRRLLKGSTVRLQRRQCSKTRKFYSFKSSLHTTPLSPLLSQRRVSANKIYLQHQRSSRIPALRQRKEDQSRISVQT